MTTREYKAIKNFFHNEMKLDRGEVRDLLREIIREVVEEEVGRFLETAAFAGVIRECVRTQAPDIRRSVANAVVEKFDISVTPKACPSAPEKKPSV